MTIAEQLRTIKHAIGVLEMSELLGVSDDTIRRQVRAVRLPYFRVGTSIRFDPDQLADWLESQSPVSVKTVTFEKYRKRKVG